MKKYLLAFVLIFCVSQAQENSYTTQIESASMARLLWGIDLDVYYEDKEAQLNTSRAFFEYTPTENKFTDFFNDLTESGDYAVRFRVYLSSVPFIIEDKVFEKLETHLDETLAGIRATRAIQIQNAVNLALATTPGFNQLPAVQQNAIRQNLIQQGLSQLDLGLAAVRDQKIDLLNERFSQVQLETAIQKVTADFIYENKDGSVSFIVIGKDRVNSHSGQESVTTEIIPDLNERAGGSAATGMIQMGHVRDIEGLGRLTTQITVFKSRNPYMDPSSYLASVINLSETEFESHKKIVNLNSTQAMIALQTERANISIAQADHNGQSATTLRGEYAFRDIDRISASYYTGSRGFLDRGYSLLYSVDVTDRWTAYVGRRSYFGYNDPFSEEIEKHEVKERHLGFAYNLFETDSSSADIKFQYIRGRNKNQIQRFDYDYPYFGFSYNKVWD